MKITKKQLKQIIKEELMREVEGNIHEETSPHEKVKLALNKIEDLHQELWGSGDHQREMMQSLYDQMKIVNDNWGAVTGMQEETKPHEAVEVPFEQLAQQVVDSWTQAFGEPEKVTKQGSYWSWWVPVEEAESRGLNPQTTNAPPVVRYPEWQFDRNSGRYRSKANPRVTFKSAVQGPGTSEVRLTFEVALGN
tara:strand:- start:514 stop:1092 length:579 start_codon:yes stop_codon:yes gene_type:complete